MQYYIDIPLLMYQFKGSLFPLSFLLLTALALLPQDGLAANEPCEHSPISRACWGKYSIETDYTHVVPDTGVTKEVQEAAIS